MLNGFGETSFGSLLTIWMIYFVPLAVGEWQFYKALKSKEYIKNLIRSLGIATVLFSIVSIVLYGDDWSRIIMLALPLMTFLLTFMFLMKNHYVAYWLGLSLLTPLLFNSYIYITAYSMSEWLNSSWATSFLGYEFFNHYIVLVDRLFFSGTAGSFPDITPAFLIGGLIQFTFWGLLLFLFNVFLHLRLNRPE